MNKKFFTLIASVFMLAASFGTANAQDVDPTFADTIAIEPPTITGTPNDLVTSLEEGENTGLYQLAFDVNGVTYLLGMDEQGFVFGFPTDAANETYPLTYGQSLFCVTTSPYVQGKLPTYDFLNKGTGLPLTVAANDRYRVYTANAAHAAVPAGTTSPITHKDSLISVLREGSELKGFGFSAQYLSGFQSGMPLYTHFKEDSVLVLAYRPDILDPTVQANGDARGVIEVVAMAANDVVNKAANTIGAAGIVNTFGGPYTIIGFNLAKPKPLWLTAADFNTLLSTESAAARTLTWWDTDINTNKKTKVTLTSGAIWGGAVRADSVPWYTKQTFAGMTPAYHYDYSTASSQGQIDTKYGLMFYQGSKPNYIRVDTNYYQTSGQGYLSFKVADTASTTIPGQYIFYAEYFLGSDSLNIYAHEVRAKAQAEPYWNSTISSTIHNSSLDPTVSGNNWAAKITAGGLAQNPLPAPTMAMMTNVAPQNLTATTVEITVFNGPNLATPRVWGFASLGLSGCKPQESEDYTTIASDLYTIRNAQGQYLVMPIYTDTIQGSTTAPAWVTLPTDKTVNPNYIPAYQWAIEKINDLASSPVRITNREFPNIQVASARFGVTNGYTLFGSRVLAKVGDYNADPSTINGVYIQKVPTAQKSDTILGYKYIDPETYNVYTYTFNYLHQLAGTTNYYLDVNNNYSDTLMYINDKKTQFELKPYGTTRTTTPKLSTYGYYTKNIANLAQLHRISYVVSVKDGTKLQNTNKTIVIDQEGRYSVSYQPQVTYGRTDSAVFFLKTNNTVAQEDGTLKHYYAMVDTFSIHPKHLDVEVNKLGIEPDLMWAKADPQKTITTAAFAVERYDDPLYRRLFHTLKPDEDLLTAPDTVEFYRVAEPFDRLYEDSHSVYSAGKGPRFLGVKAKDRYPENGDYSNGTVFNYAMYVDTAFVERPATPSSTEITPKPQYLIGVGLKVEPAGLWCPIHGMDPMCGHGIPIEGLTRGRFLINATDSAVTYNTTTGAKTLKKGGDTYIWNTNWERMIFAEAIHKDDTLFILTPAQLAMTDESKLWESVRSTANAANVIYLGNNLHKDVVWSFRLIDDNDAEDFLIESETTYRNTTNGLMIAPMNGGWIKIQNGVPVISRGAYQDAATEAEIFNIEKTTKNATAVEKDAASTEIQVISGNGYVNVKNAANKMVTVTNVLGQTVAKQAILSDNETITLPKGVVVVSVEGAKAVKAVVK